MRISLASLKNITKNHSKTNTHMHIRLLRKTELALEHRYGSGINEVSSCLSCGVYALSVLDGNSVVRVKDSFGDLITSCSTKNAFDDRCVVEIGRTVRFFVHNSTLNSTSQTGMGQYHEEISFDLYDSKNNLVLSGGAPFDDSICLERGMHRLRLTDSFGDGMHDNMAVTEDIQTGETLAMCGITSNSYFPVYQAECSVRGVESSRILLSQC